MNSWGEGEGRLAKLARAGLESGDEPGGCMHILEAQQFSRDWLEGELFPLAERLAGGELVQERPLRDRRLFWLFYEPSTRTRVSFESAMAAVIAQDPWTSARFYDT